jgi:hypothetical protein
MLEGLFYTMIGSWGLAVIEWATSNPTPALVGIGIWGAMFILGKIQLNNIRSKTNAWVLESTQSILTETPKIPIDKLYEMLYPGWVNNLRGSAVYILHRWEIFPVPATPRFVKDRIDFTPEWLGGFLWANGIKLPGGKAPEKDEGPSYLPKVPK